MRNNAFVHELTLGHVAILFDPSGPATIAVVNYAPVQLLTHSLAWQVFGEEPLGHRLLNLALHAFASVLLAAFFLSSGIPRAAAVAGGALFLLHPANVEAVVWISQLKTTLAMVLSLAALLVWRRRPALATGFFALSLLAKATAAYALPVALILDWARDRRLRWPWLASWAGLLAAYALAEFATHQRSGAAEAMLYETPFVLVRTVAAHWMRYLVMAVSSLGLSAFHEPEPSASVLHPWWLASVVVTALLVWRVAVVARRRDVELAYWVWAAISFAPVSQVFPFLYPLADRYLYFILPGLLGGCLLAGREALALLAVKVGPRGVLALHGPLVLALGLAALFAVRSVERAEIWRSAGTLYADAARHYPNGKTASVLRAKQLALAGDAKGTVELLARARDRGYQRFEQLEIDPAFASVRDDPEFRALVREMAAGWIERGRRKTNPTQTELRMIAHAHLVRGEYTRALELLERALATGGPYSAQIEADAAGLRSALASGAGHRVRLAPTGGEGP